MSVMARCRNEKMILSLQDVLRSKSITDLASCISRTSIAPQEEETVEELFDLSPIQQMYFEFAGGYEGRKRFNQSCSMRITHHIGLREIQQAIEYIVAQHSMLRARFSKNSSGTWQQRITKVSDILSKAVGKQRTYMMHRILLRHTGISCIT